MGLATYEVTMIADDPKCLLTTELVQKAMIRALMQLDEQSERYGPALAGVDINVIQLRRTG